MFILFLICLAAYTAPLCVQPPAGGALSDIQNPTFLQPYSQQRIFIQGLTEDRYYFSTLLMVTSPSVLFRNTSVTCPDYRLVVVDSVWYDGNRYSQSRSVGLGEPTEDAAGVFTMSKRQFGWTWDSHWTHRTSASADLYLESAVARTQIRIVNLRFAPQGTRADQRSKGAGFVPTDSQHAAYSFCSFGASVTGHIRDVRLESSAIYVESVVATENEHALAYTCVYLISSPRTAASSLFLCGTIDGTPSSFARGMRVMRGMRREWYAAQNFSLVPMGASRFSKNANASFPTLYRARIPHVAEFVVAPLPHQAHIDFGMVASPGNARWTQEVSIQWRFGQSAFENARGLLEIMY